MRFMRVDAEFAGIPVAVGFVVMGVVGIPIVKWFLLGAVVLGPELPYCSVACVRAS
jgi:hypothetical protein